MQRVALTSGLTIGIFAFPPRLASTKCAAVCFHAASWLIRISPRVSADSHLLPPSDCALWCLRDRLWRCWGHCSLDASIGFIIATCPHPFVSCFTLGCKLYRRGLLDNKTQRGLELLEAQMQEEQWIECLVKLEPRWLYKVNQWRIMVSLFLGLFKVL